MPLRRLSAANRARNQPHMGSLVRLITLVAVLLMPSAMSAAPAAAAERHHATMPMEHCPDDKSNDAAGGIAKCAMPCSAALPAMDCRRIETTVVIRQLCEPALQLALAGIELEIATPPPKLS
jgi:hypothetical protein